MYNDITDCLRALEIGLNELKGRVKFIEHYHRRVLEALAEKAGIDDPDSPEFDVICSDARDKAIKDCNPYPVDAH